jgi:DNA-binding IclR family transcriptional regulator
MSDKSRNGVQVIARAAQVMNALMDHPNGQSLGELAAATGLARSTVQRIIVALQDEDYVTSSNANSGLRLGPGIGRLATAISANTPEQCRQILFDLSKATRETVDLSVLRNEKMVFLDQIPGTQRLTTLSAVGEIFPLATTANGKASLAQLPRDLALNLAKNEVEASGEIFDEAKFSEMLDAIVDSHLSNDLEENNEGVSAIGFSFTNWNKEIFAISVPVPSSRFKRKKGQIEDAILIARQQALDLFVDQPKK